MRGGEQRWDAEDAEKSAKNAKKGRRQRGYFETSVAAGDAEQDIGDENLLLFSALSVLLLRVLRGPSICSPRSGLTPC